MAKKILSKDKLNAINKITDLSQPRRELQPTIHKQIMHLMQMVRDYDAIIVGGESDIRML